MTQNSPHEMEDLIIELDHLLMVLAEISCDDGKETILQNLIREKFNRLKEVYYALAAGF